MTLQESKHSMVSPLKRNLWLNLILLGVGAGILFILQIGLELDPKKVPSNLIGKDMYDIDGGIIQTGGLAEGSTPNRFKLSELMKGYDAVVLNFWASWCVSCREEAREFEAYWQKNKNSKILMVGVAIQDSLGEAKGFASEFGKTYPLILDDLGRAAIDYGVTGVPETFIIDKNAKIVFKETGPMSYTKLTEVVSQAIKGVPQQ